MKIYYVNSKGEKADLLKKPYHVTDTDVFDSRWDEVASGYEKKVEIDVFDDQASFHENMNKLYDIFAYDSENGILGKLYVNNMYIACNVLNTKKTGWKGEVYSIVTLTFKAPVLSWIEEVSRNFMKSGVEAEGAKSYPYDYPYDYAPPAIGLSTWEIDHIKPSDFAMIINGAVDNPEITINGYKYRLFTTIQSGEYVIIDSQTKSIIKRLVDGSELNIYNERDTENSVFKKIEPGTNVIEWSGGFSFSIYVYKERKEPKWM